jgi:hypothetical protein
MISMQLMSQRKLFINRKTVPTRMTFRRTTRRRWREAATEGRHSTETINSSADITAIQATKTSLASRTKWTPICNKTQADRVHTKEGTGLQSQRKRTSNSQ